MKKTNDLSTIVTAVMKIVGKIAEISLTRTCSYFCGVQHLFTCSHTFVLVRAERKNLEVRLATLKYVCTQAVLVTFLPGE